MGSMMLGLESTDSWMSHIARNEIYFGKTVSTDEICRSIRAVTRDDVVDLGEPRCFAPEAMTLTLLGDFKDELQDQKPHGRAIERSTRSRSTIGWSVEQIRIQIKRVRPGDRASSCRLT